MPLMMAGIIVANSPVLADTFDVRRSTGLVGPNGRGSFSAVVIKGVRGAISPSKDNGQERTEDAATGTSSYDVITRYALRKQARGIKPDVVLYRRMELLVTEVEDYLPFGGGWVVATCMSQEIADPALEPAAGNLV